MGPTVQTKTYLVHISLFLRTLLGPSYYGPRKILILYPRVNVGVVGPSWVHHAFRRHVRVISDRYRIAGIIIAKHSYVLETNLTIIGVGMVL